MPFVYDDSAWMAHSAETGSIATAPFALAHAIDGGSARTAHAVVLLLHLLNGALLWLLARRWLSDVGALLALTLFWLHPLPLQAVFYVTGGREVWLTTLALLALLGGLHGGAFGWSLGVAALLAALSVKASALPVLIAVPFAWSCARRQGRVGALLCVCVGLSTVGPWVVDLNALRLWAVSIWGLLALAIWPFSLAILHDWRVPDVLGMALLGMLGGLGVVAWRLSRAAWWAWLWITALTLPRAVVREAPPLTEAHAYLPFLAVWLLAGSAFDSYLTRSVYG